MVNEQVKEGSEMAQGEVLWTEVCGGQSSGRSEESVRHLHWNGKRCHLVRVCRS